MKPYPVCWLEGAFMTPQHFQQQDRFSQYLAAQYYHLVNPVRFGFSTLEIDVQSLKSGKFCISYASGILPDNTPILIDVPLTIDVAPTVSDALVTLALPAVCEGHAQVSDRDQTRYLFCSQTMIDSVRPDAPTAQVDMARPNLQLKIGNESLPGYVGLKVARIVHVDGNGVVQLDGSFIPSTINLRVSRFAMEKLAELLSRISQMSSAVACRLDSGRKFKSEHSLLQDRLLSMCFAQWQARLAALMTCPCLCPQVLYQELFAVVGGLSGLTGQEIPQPVALHPDSLGEVLPPVFQRLIEAVDVFSRDAVMEVPLDRSAFEQERLLVAALPAALGASVQCVLSIETSGVDSGWLMTNIPRFLTVAPQRRIRALLQTALSGLKLTPLAMPPIELCLPNCQTFVIDLSDPMVADCTHLALHFDKQLGEPGVRLFMIQTT